MKRPILFLLGLFLVAAFAIPDNGKLVGTIVDKATGTALSGVEVVVENTQKKTVTDEKGRYYILDIPEGSYLVIAKQDGYQTGRIENVEIRSAYTRELDFALNKEE